jgi:hypothetical protein
MTEYYAALDAERTERRRAVEEALATAASERLAQWRAMGLPDLPDTVLMREGIYPKLPEPDWFRW